MTLVLRGPVITDALVSTTSDVVVVVVVRGRGDVRVTVARKRIPEPCPRRVAPSRV